MPPPNIALHRAELLFCGQTHKHTVNFEIKILTTVKGIILRTSYKSGVMEPAGFSLYKCVTVPVQFAELELINQLSFN